MSADCSFIFTLQTQECISKISNCYFKLKCSHFVLQFCDQLFSTKTNILQLYIYYAAYDTRCRNVNITQTKVIVLVFNCQHLILATDLLFFQCFSVSSWMLWTPIQAAIKLWESFPIKRRCSLHWRAQLDWMQLDACRNDYGQEVTVVL